MDPQDARDGQGRFKPGNAGGPGRPRGLREEVVRAGIDAVEPEHVNAIMRRAVRMALEGNLGAIKFVIERSCGPAIEAPVDGVPLDVKVPKIETVADCATALDRVREAMVRGDLPITAAKTLTDMVVNHVNMIEMKDVERRLSELEQAAANVDMGRR